MNFLTATRITQTAEDKDPLLGTPLGLVYLFFLALPLLFDPHASTQAWLVSALAMAVFVPLYFRAFNAEGRAVFAYIAAMAAIGYLVLPFNLGANTFLIYAMALAGYTLTPRRAIVIGGGLILGMLAELLLLYGPRMDVFAYTMMVIVIGGMVLAGGLYWQLQRRRSAELRLSQAEVRRLATMAERERIARDLHDLLGHTLSVVALKSDLASKLITRDPQAAREQIDEVARVAREALGQVRDAVTGFRRDDLLAELAAARLALLSADTQFDAPEKLPALDADSDALFALCLREACTNVLRHADARRVSIEVAVDPIAREAVLQIGDDGRGGINQHGNGLKGMRERLEARGGRLHIDSPSGHGTQLRLHLPIALSNTPTHA